MTITAKKSLNGFRDLIVWKEAHALAIEIYKVTRNFPNDEKFGLISQLRRAASSIGANIAEGSARKTAKDQSLFYTHAKGSLREVDNFLELAHDLEYISNDTYALLLERVNKTGYLLSHLIEQRTL